MPHFGTECWVRAQVSELRGSKLSMTPYFSIVIGVAMSLLFCLCFSVFKRCRRTRRRSDPAHVFASHQHLMPCHLVCCCGGTPVPMSLLCAAVTAVRPLQDRQQDFVVVQMGTRRERLPRGVPAAVLEAFPCHEYTSAGPAALLSPAPTADSASKPRSASELAEAVVEASAHECSICLCEYEEGQMIRMLPCRHGFHQKCVDQWLASHTTCCVCRASVLPAPPLPESSAVHSLGSLEGGQQPVGEPAIDGVGSPPAAAEVNVPMQPYTMGSWRRWPSGRRWGWPAPQQRQAAPFSDEDMQSPADLQAATHAPALQLVSPSAGSVEAGRVGTLEQRQGQQQQRRGWPTARYLSRFARHGTEGNAEMSNV